MTDKSLSLLDKIVNHTGKSARQLELIEQLLKQGSGPGSGSGSSSTTNNVTNNISQTVKKAETASMKAAADAASSISAAVLKFAVVPARTRGSFITFLEKFINVVTDGRLNDKSTNRLVYSITQIGSSAHLLTSSIESFAKIKARDRKKFLNFITQFVVDLDKAAERMALVKKLGFLTIFEKTVTKLNQIVAGLDGKRINEGARAMKALAWSIMGFAGSLAISGVILTLSIPVLLPVIAMIGGIVGVYYLLSKSGTQIEKGADALKSMSMSLLIVSGGLLALTFVTMINPVATLVGIGLVAVLGGTYALLGLAEKQIKAGAVALGYVALSMIVLTGGLWLFQKAGINFTETVIPLAGTVLALALAWGLAGLGLPYIASGALAVALIGASAWFLGLGLEKISKAKFDEKQIKNFGSMAWELVKVYSAAGLASILIIPGSFAMAGIGLSLSSMADGLEKLSKIDMNKFDPIKLGKIITGISGAFAAAGTTKGTKFNLLNFVTGIELGPNSVERGIKSTLKAGAALTSIAKGLISFQKLTSGLNFNLNDPNSIVAKITLVTSAISSVFAKIGQSKSEGNSLFKAIFGNDWRQSDVEAGFKSVQGTGDALNSVAKGLSSFSNLSKLGIKDSDFNAQKPGSILYNIGKVMGVIQSAFASLAPGKTNKSLWAGIFGNDWSQTDVEKGVIAVQNSGNTLANIAKGLVSFKNLSKFGIKDADFKMSTDSKGNPLPGSLLGNISFVLNAVRSVFAQVGRSEKDSESWYSFSQGDVQTGIECVKGAGLEMSNIAKTLETFAKFKNLKSLASGIQDVILTIPVTFANVAKRTKGKEKSIEWLSNLLGTTFEQIGKHVDMITKNFSDKNFSQGYIGRFGTDLNHLLTQVDGKANNLKINSFGKFTTHIERLAKNNSPFEKFTKNFSKFAVDMKTFSESFSKISPENFDKFSNSMNVVANGSIGSSLGASPYSIANGNQIFNPQQDTGSSSTGIIDSVKNVMTNMWDKLTGSEVEAKPKDARTAIAQAPQAVTQNAFDVNALAIAIVNALQGATLMVDPASAQKWNDAIN